MDQIRIKNKTKKSKSFIIRRIPGIFTIIQLKISDSISLLFLNNLINYQGILMCCNTKVYHISQTNQEDYHQILKYSSYPLFEMYHKIEYNFYLYILLLHPYLFKLTKTSPFQTMKIQKMSLIHLLCLTSLSDMSIYYQEV